LRASGALDVRAQPLFDTAAKRAADIFDVPMAMVSLIGEDRQAVRGAYGEAPATQAGATTPVRPEDLDVPRSLSICGHVVANGQTLVVPDLARDLRFADNPALQAKGLRFYAGAPLRDSDDQVLGTLCLLDVVPRALNQREVRLLEAMAADVMDSLRKSMLQWGDFAPVPLPLPATETPSATVGQLLPAAG
jgi:GAF domain-containing protein